MACSQFIRLYHTQPVLCLAGRHRLAELIVFVHILNVHLVQAQLVNAIEDTGFEAKVIGLADSRELVLALEGWIGKATEAEGVEKALMEQHGVLHTDVDVHSGIAKVRQLCACCADPTSRGPSTSSQQQAALQFRLLSVQVTRCVHANQVQYDPNTTGPRDMLNALVDAGFQAHLETARQA